MSEKLLIEVETGENDYVLSTRISRKANALLDDVVKRSGRGKAYRKQAHRVRLRSYRILRCRKRGYLK